MGNLLLETGDALLLENGDNVLLEDVVGTTISVFAHHYREQGLA